MPASSLLTAAIEQGLNRLVALDEDSRQRLDDLEGKQLTVFVKELPWGLTLAFSDRIDVLLETRDAEEVALHLFDHSCCIEAELQVLPQLTQTSQLTRLIREHKLALHGELSVAQQVAGLFQQLDIDWEGHLSRYTGDVLAHQLGQGLQRLRQQWQDSARRAQAGLANALTEEKQVAVNQLAITHFSDQVDALRDDVQRFEARLNALNKQQSPS